MRTFPLGSALFTLRFLRFSLCLRRFVSRFLHAQTFFNTLRVHLGLFCVRLFKFLGLVRSLV